ncbi:MAG: hypothetical protein U1F76_24665 [Candidatus Competibacteraceae bacterium]
MKTIEIGVIDPKQDYAELLALARDIDAGKTMVEAVPKLNFTSLKQLFATITEKRLELIRHVATHEGLNTRQLSHSLGRDYNDVYEDVRDLCDYGLLEKDEHGVLNAPYDQIVIRTNVREDVAA